MSGELKGLLEAAREAADTIEAWREQGFHIRVISHLDADGLAAAGIIGRCLYRLDLPFRIRIARWLNEEVVRELAEEPKNPLIFTDMGSGYLELIGQELPGTPIIILDHHPPVGEAPEGVVHVNPHLFGVDGSREISGAGVTYLVAREVSQDNRDLAYLAVVGALGDLQDKYGDRGLGGVNEQIVRDAEETGRIKRSLDLLLYGRETKPIHRALAHTTNPFLPGISGEEDRCLALLSKAGIKLKEGDRWRTPSELTREEKESLFSLITEHLLAQGVKVDRAFKLIGTVYTLVREKPATPLRDGREFASLLNACGRLDRAGLGVSICLGDRTHALREAQEVLDEYRRKLMETMSWVFEEKGRLQERENVYVLHGKDQISERLVGTVASLTASNMPGAAKPVVAYAYVKDEGLAKVSLRMGPGCPPIDLGEVARIAAEACGGMGGGHDVAAGAQIPLEKVDEFLELVDRLVGERVGEGDTQA
ncbi:DHH family phosphoesterase [Candidatus Bathyarchaeota archaeon]|nr:MAG: DHH family phosphoesterase [Candidatus Bathyarchaeota archaeon]